MEMSPRDMKNCRRGKQIISDSTVYDWQTRGIEGMKMTKPASSRRGLQESFV